MGSIRQRGGRWQARVKRSGFPVEAKTFATKAEAERWARGIETEIDRGAYAGRSLAQSTTLGELLKRYAEEVTPTRRGARDEAIRIATMMRHRISSTSVANLSARAFAQYRDDRLTKCAAATVIREFSLLSAVLNQARKEWGIQFTNPIELVRKPPAPQGRERIMSCEEEERLLAALAPSAKRGADMACLVVLAIETAMRRGEMLGLKWSAVDLARRTAKLPMTKNGRSRTVPLSRRAVEALAAMPRRIDGKVFGLTAGAVEAAFRRTCTRIGLTDLHFHDLRHTATTRLATKLDNVLELSAVTGHTDLRMLKRYYHPKAEDLARKIG